ncbi:uncharacterized protein LOC113769464 isoform X2 [Coffea eugenioides]|uniref:Uncharacterized protein isoform X2 n=1 Tax=Coffea arabica TaxID=13443 RepID=A0ABM4U990_COFAR|nr:uncharacterized protein LOC113769464 isoform X2 [Coffea eugenioides]
MLVSVGVGFVAGALAVLVLEAVVLLLLIHRVNRRVAQQQQKANEGKAPESSPIHYDPSFHNKQGVVWLLESEAILKSLDDNLKEQKRKKEVFEVLPVKKHAMIKDHSLFVSELDGSCIEVHLKGCMVAAVSATSLPSRKWAKKYPIKVENKETTLYKGSTTFYIYLETSWEKESWCKALRLASSDDKEKLKWFAKLNLEFQRYVASLGAEYPSFMKPSVGLSNDLNDKLIKLDGSSSKVRQFLKKLAKKGSKSGLDSKASWTPISAQEERKFGEKSRSYYDSGVANMVIGGKLPEDVIVSSSLSTSRDFGSRSHISVSSDGDSDEKTFGDEGTLCWNLLFSRLFFDAKSNARLRSSVQERIQKLLSNMRSPSYIGQVICTAVDPGNLPPYIHAMRVLPSHMNELWAFEVDIEYCGGAILNVETRIEVRELHVQEGEDKLFESSAVGQVTSDLLESFEHLGKNLKVSEEREKADQLNKRDEGEAGVDGSRNQKNALRGSSQVSRWKSVLHSIAKQVSQVAIRDTLVLPNCENICIPWMLAEKDDWVPRIAAPFLWNRQEAAGNSTTKPEQTAQSSEENLTAEANKRIPNTCSEGRLSKSNEVGPEKHPENGSSEHYASSAPTEHSTGRSLLELTTPLLNIDEQGEIARRSVEENPQCNVPSPSLILTGQNSYNSEEEDAKHKRIGTRARMLGFGKKMGEKLEEKRKHIEERGRHIVEKMKGPQLS